MLTAKFQSISISSGKQSRGRDALKTEEETFLQTKHHHVTSQKTVVITVPTVRMSQLTNVIQNLPKWK